MKKMLFAIALATTGCLISACNDYAEDLQGLGKRVEVLEDSLLLLNNRAEQLQLLLTTMRSNGYITSIKENEDGSYTVYMMTDIYGDGELSESSITLSDGAKGARGQDGIGANLLLGVQQAEDGNYYWVFNGEWLLDDEGNRIAVGGKDGKDGKDGQDGKDGKNGKDADLQQDDIVMPQVRISNDDRTWEISLDGGVTWRDTDVPADGQDGKNGQNGHDDPIVQNIIETDNEVIFVVMLSNGSYETLVIPKNY